MLPEVLRGLVTKQKMSTGHHFVTYFGIGVRVEVDIAYQVVHSAMINTARKLEFECMLLD